MYRYINPNPPEHMHRPYVHSNSVDSDVVEHVKDLAKSIRHWAKDSHVSLNHAVNAGIYAGRLHILLELSNKATLLACQADIDEANKILNTMVGYELQV